MTAITDIDTEDRSADPIANAEVHGKFAHDEPDATLNEDARGPAPLIYCYSPATGEFLGTTFADPDPLDIDNWLIPGSSTREAPPDANPGHVVCRIEDDWVQVIDMRGTVYSKSNGEPYEYAELGPVPEGYTKTPKPGDHFKWDKGAWVIDQVAQTQALANEAVDERMSRLQVAAAYIAPLQDAVDLGEATDQEEAALTAWKRYRVQLNRVIQQPDYPHTVAWPVSPTEGEA